MKNLLFAAMMLLVSVSGYAKQETVQIQGSVGQLKAVIQVPELKAEQKVPMVIICHGFGGHKNAGLLKMISDDLEAKGIASIRFDFNGHGESEGDFQNMTVLNEIEDAKKVYEYVSGLSYVKGIALCGHSQGGVVAVMTAGQLGAEKVKALALLAPAAVLRDDALKGQLMGKFYDAGNIPEFVELFGGRKVGREYIRIAQELPIYETAREYQGATIILHGKADRVVPYTYATHFNEVIRYSHVKLYDKVDHIFMGFEKPISEEVTRFFEKEL